MPQDALDKLCDAEVLKIIDEEYKKTLLEYKTYALSETYECGECDGRITVLNKIRKKILSILT